VFAGNISAVLTFKKKGETLASLVDGATRVMTYITVGNPCPKESNNMNRWVLMSVSNAFASSTKSDGQEELISRLVYSSILMKQTNKQTNSMAFSPQANYTD
jgi:hypothetical protein